MNSLSWLIYLADVAGNLDSFFFALMIVSIIAAVIWVIVMFSALDENEGPTFWRPWRRIGYFVIAPLFFTGVILGSVVPSRDTVYAIAASEMGERALRTPTADRAFKALNSWLDRQISNESEPSAETNTTG